MSYYMRHRVRSVQQSVYQDLQDTFIACRWMPGTTTHSVMDPDTLATGTLTRDDSDLYPIIEGNPVILIDYFPNPGDKTAYNTFAVDVAQPSTPEDVEMGNTNFVKQSYLFSFVFFANSDATAVALMNDLDDRFNGRIVRKPYIELFDFSSNSFWTPVGRLEVDAFRYSRDLKQVTPAEVHLYFAELEVSDFIEGTQFTV